MTFALLRTGSGRCLTARAGRASHRAQLHGLGHSAPIAIAWVAALYFIAQMIRGVL